MKSNSSPSHSVGRGLVYLLAIALAFWILIPIYLIGVAAFSPSEVIYGWPKSIVPRVLSAETMLFFLNAQYVLPSVGNSVKVAVLTLGLALLVGAPAGYSLARYVFRGKDFFRIMLLSTRGFPMVILAIPLTVTFMRWDMYDSLFSVALVHTAMALPTTIMVTSSVFLGIQGELEEAAMTLGCNRLQAFIRVALPLALPGLAASAIFTFVMSWNEVFAATILTMQNRTLPARVMVQLRNSPIPFRFAGGFFILLPAILFMFFIRRYLFSLWGVTIK